MTERVLIFPISIGAPNGYRTPTLGVVDQRLGGQPPQQLGGFVEAILAPTKHVNITLFSRCALYLIMSAVIGAFEKNAMIVSMLSGCDLPANHGVKSNHSSFLVNDQSFDANVRTETTDEIVTSPDLKAVSITVFRIEYDPAKLLPQPAPPPKLHYSTFWRTIARKIYDRRAEELILSARALSPKLNLSQ